MFLDIMLKLGVYIPTKRYKYRTAMVVDRIPDCEYGIEKDETSEQIQKMWSRMMDSRTGANNHECYQVKTSSGEFYYVQFSDFHIYIGKSIREERW